MLDLSNTNPAYRLGRLFAVLERIQEEASPGLNATIRDRYYGAASSTPVAVFTTLLRLKNAHLKKLMPGRVSPWFEKLLGEVLGPVTDFPRTCRCPTKAALPWATTTSGKTSSPRNLTTPPHTNHTHGRNHQHEPRSTTRQSLRLRSHL
jgi:hypothetical protein